MQLQRLFQICVLFLIATLTSGCRTLFPVEEVRSRTSWTNFNAADSSFDAIVPGVTTTKQLKALGFNLESTPNVKVLTYLDIIFRFIPNQSITKEDLPPPVRDSISAKANCHAYELEIEVKNTKRYGNLALDVFGFKKKSHITGWNFKALIIIKDDVVTYKLRSGQPNVDRFEKKTKPLGPLQELDGLVGKIPGMF